MVKLKKRLSSVLAVVFTAVTCLSSVPVKAEETTPKVTFVGVEHSPLVVGDSEDFYLSSEGTEKVQYRVFQNKIGTDNWEDLTAGYTDAKNAKDITTVNGLAKYEAGKYKLSIWVKKADSEGKFKNKNGSYDSYYITYLNCVNKDDNNRVYTNGDMDVEKDNYVVGETVKVNGIKDISGMKEPYTYKLHIYDVNSNEWKFDKGAYRKDLSFVPDKPGTYVLDVWAMSSNSTLWAKEAKLNGRIYEAWKLKVISVTEKVEKPEEPEVNIVEDGVIFGSEDEKNPMEINKNVNITGKNVAFNNVNVKGNVTVTGDYTTLNNVKVEGTLFLNPGENGTVNLNNVTADVIEVLSGAANSIHFNNVNVKVLNVNSKNVKESVRIELKGKTNIERTEIKSSVILEATEGSFGNVEVLENQNKTESLLELRGTFDKNITVKTKATLKTAKDAKISKVVIEPANNEKITLDGNFGQVEVNKKAVVATTENTKIEKVTTNSSGITLQLGKGSKVTTLDQKGQTVTQTGTGTVGNKVNSPVTPPYSGGGTSDTTVYVNSVTLNKTVELVVGNVQQLTATVLPINATNKTLTWLSLDKTIATVDTTGKVTAVAEGQATITATSVNGKTDTCTVTVLKDLGIKTEVNVNMVTITLEDLLYANKAVTCKIVDSEENLVYPDQVNKADNTTGKVTFQTVLNPGKYYGTVNVDGVGKSIFEVTVEATTIDSIFDTIVVMAKNQPALNGEDGALSKIDYKDRILTLEVKESKENMTLKEIFEIFEIKNNVILSPADKLYLASLYSSLNTLDVKVNDKTVNTVINEVLQGTDFADDSLIDVIKALTYGDFIMLVNKCEAFKADPMTISMGKDSLTSITINDKPIYGGDDKHISRQELREAFGISGSLSGATLENFQGKKIVIKIGEVDYTINIEKSIKVD